MTGPAALSSPEIRYSQVTTFYASGVRQSRGALGADGRHVGLWTHCHPDGSVESQGQYCCGRKHGRWRLWHANGQLWIEVHYAHGRQHGRYREWRRDGRLWVESEYEYGNEKRSWMPAVRDLEHA